MAVLRLFLKGCSNLIFLDSQKCPKAPNWPQNLETLIPDYGTLIPDYGSLIVATYFFGFFVIFGHFFGIGLSHFEFISSV